MLTDYNSIAREYNNHEKNAATLWVLGYRPMLNLLSPLANKSILDYGCGSGNFCRILNDYKAIVTGVDTSEAMIKLCKEKQSSGSVYHQINSGDLDFIPDEAFNYAVSNFVFCTISSLNEILKIMKSVNRVLKKNGSFLIMNANWDESNGKEFISFKLQKNYNLSSGQSVTSIIKSNPPLFLNDFYWSKHDYVSLLKEAGFSIQNISEPLAKGDHLPWVSENSHPPYYIITAEKLT
jgi:ubiquinone/menaquinone biosynthesis C-methylase UbiE